MHELDGQREARPRDRLRLVICESHRVLREALGSYLLSQPGIESATLAADGDEAVRCIRTGADALVLDVDLAGDSSSLDVLEATDNIGLHVAVLMLGTTEDMDLISRALTLGAGGFCPKDVSGQVLYDAILAVAQGEVFLPDSLVAPVAAALSERRRRDSELMRLTPRQRDVLRLLAEGHRRDEIARRLGLSRNTIRTHLASIMDKFGIHSQVAAAALGRRLVDLQPPTDNVTALPDVAATPKQRGSNVSSS